MNTTATKQRRRQGFTLVELLVVITVIGILAGLAIPAVMGALKAAKVSAMKTELENLSQGIEAYKTKYGDYPPDFSNWDVVRRHYLKIFPDIDASELTLLYRLCDFVADDSAAQIDTTVDAYPGSVMDRAEALVWALGGFSSDPQYPFTGTGGPLVMLPAAAASATTQRDEPQNYQYNTERDNSFVEFDSSRLSVVAFDPALGTATYANRTRSGDEPPASYNLVSAATGALFLPDLFPTYALYQDSSPAVYFDSRTYGYVDTSVSAASTAFNGYARYVDNATDIDGVRPMYSDSANANLVPSGSGGTYATLSESVRAWNFMNPQTFQILTPGLDRRFGAITDLDGPTGGPSNAVPVYFQYKSGGMVFADTTTATNPQQLLVPDMKRYDLTPARPAPFAGLQQRENQVEDNIANFSNKTFGDDIP